MSNVNDGGRKRRKVNPALLLGGGSAPEVVDSGDFDGSAGGRGVAGRKFLSGEGKVFPAGGNDNGFAPVEKISANDLFEDGVEGSQGKVPKPPVVRQPQQGVPVLPDVEGAGSRGVDDNVPVFPVVRQPRRRGAVMPTTEELNAAGAGEGDTGESDTGVFKDEVSEPVLPPVTRQPRRGGAVMPTTEEIAAADEDTGEVDTGKDVDSVPAPGGFFLPGEARPGRKRKAVLPTPEDLSPVKPEEPVSKKVNPRLTTGERDVSVKPAARPSFFLDSDKIPAHRPVDFSKNKTVVEGDVSVEPVSKPGGRKKSSYVSKVESNVDAGDWSDDVEGTSLGLGGEVDARYVAPQYNRGFHLTERDIIMMKFLARYRYAYVDQLARLVDSIPRNVSARLRTLEKRGFVRKEPITDRQHLWTVRKAGLVLVDSPFREIKKGNISYATIAHTIGLANLGVEFEREAGGKDLLGEGKGNPDWVMPERRWKLGIPGNPDGFTRGEMTVTEREIRQGQMRWRGNRSYKELREIVDAAVLNSDAPELEEGNEGLFVVYGRGGKGGEHVPDLVVSRPRDEFGRPQHIAIELELTQKTPREWRKILRNFRDNGLMYSKVYYFTHKKSIGSALMRIAEEEGFADKFIVRRYVPQNSKIPFWG